MRNVTVMCHFASYSRVCMGSSSAQGGRKQDRLCLCSMSELAERVSMQKCCQALIQRCSAESADGSITTPVVNLGSLEHCACRKGTGAPNSKQSPGACSDMPCCIRWCSSNAQVLMDGGNSGPDHALHHCRKHFRLLAAAFRSCALLQVFT